MSAADTGARPTAAAPAGRAGGPLAGIRVVEIASIGPGPHAAMVLADLGADVVRVQRPGNVVEIGVPEDRDLLLRSRTVVTADLKDERQRAEVLKLVDRADVLIEGFRPGVAERLGIGPEDCHHRNPTLVYGRMTGWGQRGPWARKAGHDINYLAVTGLLDSIGTEQGPVVPLNLVADFGGGSMLLVTGILSGLVARGRTGRGVVVDAAMVDGASVLGQLIWALHAYGAWIPQRASNMIDGGSPFYRVYECADGRHMAVGALEPQFYAAMLRVLELDAETLPDRMDRANWPRLHEIFETRFRTRTRDEWTTAFEPVDACVTPVLSLLEATTQPHLVARGTFVEVDGVTQPGPAPRFEPGPPAPVVAPGRIAADIPDVLRRWS